MTTLLELYTSPNHVCFQFVSFKTETLFMQCLCQFNININCLCMLAKSYPVGLYTYMVFFVKLKFCRVYRLENNLYPD